ncbi:MAG: serine/threonine-protein kinase [Verrucomicrobiota bacterium]
MSERYEIRGRLGRGGMSAVYRAFDSVMGREVALKRLLPLEETNLNEDAGDILASEAAALAKFQHPNIVTVYAFEEDEDGPYVVMELVDGMDLHEVLQDGALSLEDFKDISIQCLEPLASAAEQNLLHRDIKPGNIMLTMTASERFLVKILDFGLAKFSQQPSTQTLDQAGSFLGSIDYIAPEQLELLPLDQRTDLYSLGCVLYYALAQRAPFTGDNPAETSMNHLNHVVAPIHKLRSDLGDSLSDWLMSMIARDPGERPANALDALERFLQAAEAESSGEEIPVAVAAAEQPVVEKRPQILTGNVSPIPEDSAGTGAVKRPVLNTSPQVPRPRTTSAIKANPDNPGSGRDWSQITKNPVVVTSVGVFLLGLFLFLLFRDRNDPRRASVERPEPVAVAVPPPVEVEVSTEPKFQMPEPFNLGGEPQEVAPLAGDPPALLRFTSADGVLDASLNPVVQEGKDVEIWVNQKTRGKWRSLYPLAGDAFAERIPSLRTQRASEVPGLKTDTLSLAFGNRDGLVTRTGVLPLEGGFTVFVVGKVDRGSGSQVFLEPNSGGGALASIRIDFSGNVIGASRLGAVLKETSLSVPWSEDGVGVIAYGCDPKGGEHRLLGFPASNSRPKLVEGTIPSQPSPFQKMFIGKHDSRATPDGPKSTWILEILLYDQLLPSSKMTDISEQLSRFYFKRPDS